jgi:hypothetical protein
MKIALAFAAGAVTILAITTGVLRNFRMLNHLSHFWLPEVKYSLVMPGSFFTYSSLQIRSVMTSLPDAVPKEKLLM